MRVDARVCYSRSAFLSFFQNEGGTAITVLRTSRRLQHQSRRNGNYQWRHAPRRLLVRDESDAIRYIPVYTHLHIAGWFFLSTTPLRRTEERSCGRKFLSALMARAVECERANISYYRRRNKGHSSLQVSFTPSLPPINIGLMFGGSHPRISFDLTYSKVGIIVSYTGLYPA